MRTIFSREIRTRQLVGPMVALLFEPRDCWVGLHWEREYDAGYESLSLYICALPCFPVRISLYRKVKEAWW